MKANQIRENFLKYFEKKGHKRIKSSSLVPAEDPTLLFTNAGMVPFKDYFLGLKKPPAHRVTSSQKCVRAGGKHNDLENVGFTPRHHTFFEMLGNFSFGDYFKKEAIAFAWELLTEIYKLPKEKLWITVFETDDEAIGLWQSQGVPKDRIYRLGEKDNFWAMGDTGPCGPCSEIHYDWGTRFGGHKDATPATDDGRRFFEIWNLVFMQFNRDTSGKLNPLPKPSVDTGAGLERLSCVLQGVFSNYDTDLFQPIIQSLAKQTKHPYHKEEAADVSLRVIADHLRSGTMLIADGVLPSNEGRGYVLRRILRRAIRHGKKLGQDRPFIYKNVGQVVKILGDTYPDLKKKQGEVEEVLREEEERFHETLHRGMGVLEQAMTDLRQHKKKILPGEVAFKLYDTFGFPLDLTQVIATEEGFEVDEKGFELGMEKQRSQSVWSGAKGAELTENLRGGMGAKPPKTQFLGYRSLKSGGKLLHLFDHKGKKLAALKAPARGYAVFDKTPFYAESGGQVGDNGVVSWSSGEALISHTFKVGAAFVHELELQAGTLKKGAAVKLAVDEKIRKLTAINHTATHLLHAALRHRLGDRVKQAGSLVNSQYLRFDFSFPRAMTEEEIVSVEQMINQQIRNDLEVKGTEMPYEKAIRSGALAFFDEKYGDRVRVIQVGGEKNPVSVEFCGGTHLTHTGEIGLFKIRSESSVASGTRRIEAISSETAVDYLVKRSEGLRILEKTLAANSENLAQKVEQLLTENKRLKLENEKLQVKTAQMGTANSESALWEKSIDVNGLKIVREKVPPVAPKVLRTLVDQVRDKLQKKAVVLLATVAEGKVLLCLGISPDLVASHSAAQLIKPLAEILGGSGGGRDDFAQAGGSDPLLLDEAFKKLESLLRANP